MERLELKLNNKNWKSMLPFLKEFGPQIRNVRFDIATPYDEHGSVQAIYYNKFLMCLKVLILMENVKKLTIKMETKNNLKTDNAKIEEIASLFNCEIEKFSKKFNLEKLENLEITLAEYNAEAVIEELLTCINIKKIKFSSKILEDCLIPFSLLLSQQDNLEHLDLEVTNLLWIFTLNKMNFKLKSYDNKQVCSKSLETFQSVRRIFLT